MTTSVSSATVHLIDDDASMLRSLARLLSAAGHPVAAWPSGAAFLREHGPERRGCVIADLRMPGLGGLELQAELGRTENPLPVIILTGHGDIPTSVHAIKGGAEDFLTKPVRREALLDAVGRALVRDAEGHARRAGDRALRQRFKALTPREHEVLTLMLAGRLNKQMAGMLGTTERTIKAHRAAVMHKVGAQSPAELGRLAREAGV